MPYSIVAAAILLGYLPALAADPAVITNIDQRPWIINANGVLKSETELTIENHRGQAVDAWVKVRVPGKPDCMEALGSLPPGTNKRVVHVPELASDGDPVTFAIHDNAAGNSAPLGAKTLPQKKIRHWHLYVGHNTHLDIGYTDYQEDLKTKKWPGFWDQALLDDMPRSDSWPDDAKVRLEVEGVYQLDTSLPVRSADWFETLRERLAQGRFAYGAAFANNAHGNWGAEELARSIYPAERHFKDKTGVESSKNIIMRDEPVLSWGVIDALVEAGAKSFAIHHNADHNPWRGTTIYPELFYAQGRNPANRLLVWNVPVGNYSIDELSFRDKDLTKLTEAISAKLMGYQASGTNHPAGQYAPARATDGITGKTDLGEWASNGERTPWIRLAWPAPRTIHRIRLHDRANSADNATSGILTFSDGSTLPVTGIPADGSAKEITIAAKTADWIRFNLSGGAGPNVGLSEIEVFSGTRNIAPEATATASSAFGASRHDYPYDLAMVNFTYDGDNRPMDTQVYDNIKALNDKGYVYPRIINANYKEFFEDVAKHWGDKIPSFKGTIEDWWNFGAASTAYETGINRMNHDKLAAAETLATVAGIAIPERRHPSEALANAYENMLLYDEHTWGSPRPAVDEQWRWKRNTAIASDVASTKVLNESMAAIGSRIPATGPTIVVYNNLSWTRSDLVTLEQEQLPARFTLTDGETGTPVRHQKADDGTVVFVAGNVPGHGYKTFKVTARDSDPGDPPSITATADTLENRYFKVTFDQAGNVTSILDKQHGNKKIVDPAAPQPLNQYVLYKEGALTGQVTTATLAASAGPVLGCMSADGTATGLDSLRRKVVLYDALPRIDIINDAVKGPRIANVEMGYFAFPLKVDNFMLRHEMPTGDMKPGVTSDINDPNTEQYFTSSTAFSTVNRWIDASNQRDWGVTFAALNAPLVSYGRPDIGMSKGGWDIRYNAPKPWIYSMAFNNEWQTNFQKTQPGRVIFRYSLRGHAGGTWQAGNAETFGAETSSPLRASVIKGAQPGHSFDAAKGQFVGISEANVTLTTAKMAEANGEGIILRFNEIKGMSTSVKVDLGWFRPVTVTETDLVENDKGPMTLADGVISFTIQPFGFKTFRLIRGAAPQTVTSVTAAFDTKGCLVSWKDQPDAVFYEVFRSTRADFKPGTGTYLSTVSASHYYDPTVKDGLTRTYYYAVRAAGAGQKSGFSVPVKAVPGLAADTTAPSVPVLAGEALHATKVTLSWEPSTDNHAVAGYQLFRDGARIADLSAVFNSWMDDAVKPGTTYRYTVKARDIAGNLSLDGGPAAVTTLKKSP
jgi:hypothetical protein